jgi:hypothetical protein
MLRRFGTLIIVSRLDVPPNLRTGRGLCSARLSLSDAVAMFISRAFTAILLKHKKSYNNIAQECSLTFTQC